MTARPRLITIQRRDHGIALVTIDAPPVNALTKALAEALLQAIDELAANPGRVIVVTGRPDGFSAGGDIGRFGELEDQAAAHLFVRRVQNLFDRVAAIPSPVIAAIHGFALGGGLELALACDIRVAAPNARLALPETRWGLLAGAGGTQRLARLVGPGAAKLMMYTATPVDAAQALRIGLVDRVADDPLAEALLIAQQIAGNSPGAVRRVKRCVDEGLSLAEGLELEARLWSELIPLGDHAEGAAAFFARRAPRYDDPA